LWGLAVGLSVATLIGQVQVNMGERDTGWPFFKAQTKAGRVAAIAVHGALTAFFFFGFLLSLLRS